MTMVFSWIPPWPSTRRTPIEITAEGMQADTVMPAKRPR